MSEPPIEESHSLMRQSAEPGSKDLESPSWGGQEANGAFSACQLTGSHPSEVRCGRRSVLLEEKGASSARPAWFVGVCFSGSRQRPDGRVGHLPMRRMLGKEDTTGMSS
jgi:hypothetical protein